MRGLFRRTKQKILLGQGGAIVALEIELKVRIIILDIGSVRALAVDQPQLICGGIARGQPCIAKPGEIDFIDAHLEIVNTVAPCRYAVQPAAEPEGIGTATARQRVSAGRPIERVGAGAAPKGVMSGERDSAVRFGSVEPMKASVANLRKVVLLPGCGHWVQQERPAEVNAEMIDFLRRESRR